MNKDKDKDKDKVVVMSVNKWSEKTLSILGPVGSLEVNLGQHSTNKVGDSKAGFIMCHPHPLYSGTMDNKVVTTLVRGASRLIIEKKPKDFEYLDTIRFNFRGVGESKGKHDNGKGEQDDLGAIVDYAMTELEWKKVYLAGFSFGAGIACLYAVKHPENVAGLFLVAPAVHHFDAPSVLPYEFESHVYMGNADEVVPFDEVEHWVNLLTPQPHFHIFERTSHFFHGHLIDLKKVFLADLEVLLESN
jgi:alpha/beta superfamily hydrolase